MDDDIGILRHPDQLGGRARPIFRVVGFVPDFEIPHLRADVLHHRRHIILPVLVGA